MIKMALATMDISFKIINEYSKGYLEIYINLLSNKSGSKILIGSIYPVENYFKLSFPNIAYTGTLEYLINWLKQNMDIEITEEVIDKFNAQLIMNKIRK